MATIGTLNVAVKATTGKFSKGMNQAEKKMKGFGGAVQNMRAKLNGLGSSIGGLGAIGGAFAGIFAVGKLVGLAQTIDQTQKIADNLGIAAGKLQEFQFAASQSGVSSDQLSSGLRRMTKNISDAANGLGVGKKALEDLGLSASDLQGMSVDESFLTISQALSQVTNKTEQVRIALDLFGRQGANLINTMKGGRKSIEDFGKEAQRLGIIASEETGRKLEAMNDSIDVLQRSLEGLGRGVLGFTSGPLTALATGLSELIPIATRLASVLGAAFKTAVSTTVDVINLAPKALNAMGASLDQTEAFLSAFSTELENEAYDQWNEAMGLANTKTQDLGKSASKTAEAVGEIATATKDVSAAMEKAKQVEFDRMDQQLSSVIDEAKRLVLSPEQLELDRIGQQEAQLSGVLARDFDLLTDQDKNLFNQAFVKLAAQRKDVEASMAPKQFGPVFDNAAQAVVDKFNKGVEFGPAFDADAKKVVREFEKAQKGTDLETVSRKIGAAAEVDTNLIDLNAWSSTANTVEEKKLKQGKTTNELLGKIAVGVENALTLA